MRIPAIAALVLTILSTPAWAGVVGEPKVIDGDTLHFPIGVKVRIYGLDTLEKAQKCDTGSACVPCGLQSKEFATQLIGKSEVTCELKGEKSYDREIASCSVNGKDYAESMIAAGWGLAYRRYLPKKGKGHAYVAAEEKAKAAKLGIWATRFIPPSDWRNRSMRLICEQ